jgi:hypothetical protein
MKEVKGEAIYQFKFECTPSIATALIFSRVTSILYFYASILLTFCNTCLDTSSFMNVHGQFSKIKELKGEAFHQFKFECTPSIATASAFSRITSVLFFYTSILLDFSITSIDTSGYRNVNGYFSDMKAVQR